MKENWNDVKWLWSNAYKELIIETDWFQKPFAIIAFTMFMFTFGLFFSLFILMQDPQDRKDYEAFMDEVLSDLERHKGNGFK
jgi:hypothetical protein